MELKNIEAFLMVVEKGSFSTAAEALFVTQPTISVRIQMLEQELQNSLFNRISGRKVILTPTGEKVLPYFREAYENITNCLLALKESSHEQKTITIACPNHMGVEIMPELLKALYSIFPHIDFSVNISTTKEILEDIRSGTVDIGLAYIQSASEVKDLNAIHIVNEQTILVCSPEHPLTQAGTISTTELKKERIITYSKPFLTTQLIEQYLKKNNLKDVQMVEINNLGWIKMMVRKELGVAFLQEMIVSEELRNGTIVELPINQPLPTAPIYLVLGSQLQQEIQETVVCATKKLFKQR
ncbi:MULTISPECIES: LysR family transcriptional regulator [unclassified Paenibacillus]|uniref:LysR family transcriptional regulator n=1 Tax=unclassified Paenibacillus TaxID=185978 RepID=UPI001AE36B1C|nr:MULTISPECIES: LysR family transcriptional regulator [unclassified Paenibacillus]MBP1156897.1 DNA-binding transcriptional LysR family regulator [Paenibacillus sp. PvP091]MBP1172364.1 DNA-binding transcriptional LysR family regulator [Paenibacillus sp. PvR098]MBP2438745.1 DNA-binding transcriptional LysR family regulator [Paenibacillus sp. PvP052]